MVKNRKKKMCILLTIVFCSILTAQIPAVVYAEVVSPAKVVELKLNTPVNGVISKGGEVNWYKFNATAGSAYVVEIFNTSITMDTFITLYAFNETMPLSWSSSKIIHNFTASGTYFIEVKHTDSEYGIGRYSISLRPASPPAITVVVYDSKSSQNIAGAEIQVYHPLTYKLLGENVTSKHGNATIRLPAKGYYLVKVSSEGYNDLYGASLLVEEGTSIRGAGLMRVEYSGLVLSSALIKEIVVAGRNNTLNIALYNVNSTYPITLTNITVRFPWFGFYEGEVKGEGVITNGMPVTIPPKSLWTYSTQFRAPADVTVQTGFSFNSYVDFNVKASAWRTTFKVVEGAGLKETRSLTTATIYPEQQSSQGFRTSIVTVSQIPTVDPQLNKKVEEVSARILDVSSKMEDIKSNLVEVVYRVGEVNSELTATSSTLKRIRASLEEIGSKLTMSDDKLKTISTSLAATNGKLDAVASQLETVNRWVSTLSSQQQETNSKLDGVDKQLTATREETSNLVRRLFEDVRTLLIIMTIAIIIVAAVNTIHLTRISKPASK